MSAATPGGAREIPDIAALIRATRVRQTSIAGTLFRIYSSGREHHMTNILAFFSTRTLLQIAFILASAVAMKAWSLGLLFGG
jgi:hypothetical protein